jgi:hypothetical protein
MELQLYLLYVYETWSLAIMEGCKIALEKSRWQNERCIMGTVIVCIRRQILLEI